MLEALNGKIVLIRGNHDRFAKKEWSAKYFLAMHDVLEQDFYLEDGTRERCILSHLFLIPPDKDNKILLHGHSHVTEDADTEIQIAEEFNRMGRSFRAYNVGCMYYDYEPVTLDEIIRGGPKRRPNYGSTD